MKRKKEHFDFQYPVILHGLVKDKSKPCLMFNCYAMKA
jgi:hypothetical protein